MLYMTRMRQFVGFETVLLNEDNAGEEETAFCLVETVVFFLAYWVFVTLSSAFQRL